MLAFCTIDASIYWSMLTFGCRLKQEWNKLMAYTKEMGLFCSNSIPCQVPASSNKRYDFFLFTFRLEKSRPYVVLGSGFVIFLATWCMGSSKTKGMLAKPSFLCCCCLLVHRYKFERNYLQNMHWNKKRNPIRKITWKYTTNESITIYRNNIFLQDNETTITLYDDQGIIITLQACITSKAWRQPRSKVW